MNTAVNLTGSKRWLFPVLYLLIILMVVAGFVALWWVNTLPERVDEQQTIVIGPTRFAPDSDASVRVVVQNLAAGQPVAGAQVKVSLNTNGQITPLYEGQTDDTGSAPVSFRVPTVEAAGDTPPQLIIETISSAGQDRVEQPVTIQRDYKLLLTSDKPLYQPGQVIHMRALALSSFDLTPARGATINFLVEDAKGNKVFRHSAPASDFGVGAADFTLADQVNQGNYKLSVAIGDTSSEKTVEVRPYVLPKFGVKMTTDRTFYLPGQRVEGTIQADYFFGKPVALGKVQLTGSVWDVQRTAVVDLQGQTDAKGAYQFSFDLPEYFAGGGLESGHAQFALEVTVIDQTDHPEQTSLTLPIAAEPLLIEAVAESGQLKPGVENIIYILTSYPDGRPAPTNLQVSIDAGATTELSTGELGLAEFKFVPQPNRPYQPLITARDETGLTALRQINFETETGYDHVLLRADRAAYVVGETMNLAALTPVEAGSVYLDIVKSGQTLSTRSTKVQNGQAEFAVDVTPDLYGTLELHAYKVLADGTIMRDTRLVVVDAPNALAIAVSADKDTYLPGEPSKISFQTTDANTTPVKTALGVAIVDESVFALQRQDPGFAKLYFLLEKDLLEPRYQIKAWTPGQSSLPSSIPPDQAQIRQAQDTAAKATWAGAPIQVNQPINSRPQKLAAVQERQQQGYDRLAQSALGGMMVIPLTLLGLVVAALWGSGAIKRTLVRLLVALGIMVLVGGCLGGWFVVMSREFRRWDPENIIIGLAALLGLAMLLFIGYAWLKGNRTERFFSLLTLAWIGLLFLLIQAAETGAKSPPEGLLIAAAIAYILIPIAYLLLGQMRWVQTYRFSSITATGIGALATLPVLVVLPLVLLSPRVGMVRNFAGAPEGDVMMLAGAVPEPPMAQVVEEAKAEAPAARDRADADQQTPGQPPRLRQFFPETLYWNPEVITDDAGQAMLDIPMADSITTWRLTALASSQDGRLGFTTQGVRVFQDFFVDIDLPVSLTQGDEISIPVGVFNYLPTSQQVRLEVKPEPWFELKGPGEQTLTIASNDIEVVYFPIRVVKFGHNGFQVTAWGEKLSDAIRREVNVLPDGKEIRLTDSDWLRESKELALQIPPEAVRDTPYVEVKIYPGVLAQVVEGLEKILRLPFG